MSVSHLYTEDTKGDQAQNPEECQMSQRQFCAFDYDRHCPIPKDIPNTIQEHNTDLGHFRKTSRELNCQA